MHSVWPPPPAGQTSPIMPVPPKTLTGRVWTDVLLGAAGQYLGHLAVTRLPHFTPSFDEVEIGVAMITEFFFACIFGAIGYYGFKRIFPFVARGSGYATLVLFAAILGGLFTCHALPF